MLLGILKFIVKKNNDKNKKSDLPNFLIPSKIKKYGIYRLKFAQNCIILCSYELVKEVCDDTRFEKDSGIEMSNTIGIFREFIRRWFTYC